MNTKLLNSHSTSTHSKDQSQLSSRIPSFTYIPRPQQRSQPPPPLLHPPSEHSSSRSRIFVYCPVCRKDYLAEEIEDHGRIHNRPVEPVIRPVQNFERREIVNQNVGMRPVSYPMVQPVEFHTSEVRQSPRRDFAKKKQEKKPIIMQQMIREQQQKEQKIIQTNTTGTQTIPKPPLQQESNHSDVFNWMDHLIEGQETKFDMDEAYSRNVGLEKKRKLDEWEIMRLQEKKKNQ